MSQQGKGKLFWAQATVGLLVLVAVGFVGYYTIAQQVDRFSDYKYKIRILFPSVEGLRQGSKVRILGVDVGRVKELRVIEDNVLVYASLSESAPLYEDYKIEIRNESAIGGKFISIYPGSQGSKRLATTMDGQLLKGLSYRDPFTSISQMIDENRANVYKTLRNVREITAKVNKGEGTLGKLINDDTAHEETKKIVKRSEKLVGEVRDGVEDAREQAPVTSFLRTILTVF